MKVSVYDPFVNEKEISSYGGKKIDNFYEAIKVMDYVSIHILLNPLLVPIGCTMPGCTNISNLIGGQVENLQRPAVLQALGKPAGNAVSNLVCY